MSHDYQLLIKNLLLTPAAYNPIQEIAYKSESDLPMKSFTKESKS